MLGIVMLSMLLSRFFDLPPKRGQPYDTTDKDFMQPKSEGSHLCGQDSMWQILGDGCFKIWEPPMKTLPITVPHLSVSPCIKNDHHDHHLSTPLISSNCTNLILNFSRNLKPQSIQLKLQQKLWFAKVKVKVRRLGVCFRWWGEA